ncbi:hypothetical protein [Cohnella sp. GCM10027633]|uniref:hypothetical protein n=1 Tax=unclassified Cohnella TaxID=2636738 RepID=UPI003639F653
MDQLRQEIATLEEQEISFQNDLNNAQDDNQAQSFVNELNIVRNKLSEKRHELQQLLEKELQRAEVIEEKTHAAEIPFAVAGIDFTDLPAEVITLIDAVVKADRRRLLNEHAIELEQNEEESRKTEEALKLKLEELEGLSDGLLEQRDALNIQLSRSAAEIQRLSEENHKLSFELSDARKSRDNSSRLLEEANNEIARQRTQIEDFQRAQEYNNRQTEQVSANDEEKASISAALDAVKKLYAKVEDYGSIMKVTKPDGSFELVKRQEVATEWQAADVPDSFRDDDNTSDTQDNTVSATETAEIVAPPALQFPGEDAEVPAYTASGEVAATDGKETPQTLEDRVTALEAAVFGQVKAAA